MLVGIYVNTNKEFALEVSETLKSRLDDFKVNYEILERGFVCCPDLIIVIGGDGTVLDVAEHAAKSGIPVMALNAGSVGFLSSFETNEIDDCVKSVLNSDFKFDERPLLECNVNGKIFYALNDVSVQRIWDKNINGCTLLLSLNIDGVLADKFRADGIVVATPTGSTAYSLSAGGAILAPKINALIATPLCAHTLRSKPIVFSDDAVVEISVLDKCGGVYCDGKFVGETTEQSSIIINKSNYKLKLVNNKNSFYKTLFEKLTTWNEK